MEGGLGHDDGKQDQDSISFKSSDLNQLIISDKEFCSVDFGRNREIYYTSVLENKAQLDEMMNRVNMYFDFICENFKTPGMLGLI